MANWLKMAVVESVYTLRAQGLSQRQIARLLGIDRGTVRRHIRQAAGSNAARAPTGSDELVRPDQPLDSEGQNRPNPPTGSNGLRSAALGLRSARPTLAGDGSCATVTQPSSCEPFREVILGKLEQGLTAQRIYQDLVADHGFAAKYHSVRRFVRKLSEVPGLPFRRMECEPGVEAQVDFGQGATVLQPDGRRKRPHAFRIILSHSRKAYSEVVYRQSTEDFIRCLENAFWHFGGVPKTLVIDNLKAAVTKADWFDPELNPKIVEFCRHYGTVILPCKPYTPRHKGKVEAGVKYVQSNALKGRTFESLAAQNRYLLEWESQTADTRIHGTTRKQVKKTFEEAERPALLPLPPMRFPSFRESRRVVSRDGHIEVAKAYYSAPPEYLGRKVWTRWDGRLVRILDDQMRLIHEHVAVEPGRFSTHPQHISARKISGVERGTAWMLRKISVIGPQAGRWAEAVLQVRGVEGVRVLQGLMSLTYRHDADGVEKACEIAHGHSAYRLRDVKNLIDRQAPRQERFEFIEEDPIIRPLSEYDELVHTAFNKEQP